MTPPTFLMCAQHARRAIRRGDVALAERWYKVGAHVIALSERIQRMQIARRRVETPHNPADHRR
ncbi:MAG TPA: hypothetical protein VHC73_15225 [Vitreimonas sp.]|nr:hypothetical protein [Vitreimonas sp.]